MRVLDICISLFLLLLFSLPLLVICAWVYLYDRGPVFFVQKRIGKDLKPFDVYKVRTMSHTPARTDSGQQAGAHRTVRNDPRITPIGRYLRKAHVDELPQLFNVLKGDMSIVGVRPDTPAQEADYSAQYWQTRHTYRPGITGLAQVMNRESDGMEGRSKWERVWIENRSLFTYFKILFLTARKMIKRDSF